MLALPVQTIEHNFANGYVYLSSFHLTQPQLFGAVLKATGTAESDWDLKRSTTGALFQDSQEKFQAGEFHAIAGMITGTTFQVGDYSAKVAEHDKLLQLPAEDLDDVIKRAAEVVKDLKQELQWK